MLVYFEYALKVTVCLAASFLFYALLLKRMTYYTWNRYFLLVFSLISFIVPLVDISGLVQSGQGTAVFLVGNIPNIHSFEPAATAGTYNAMFVYRQLVSIIFIVVSVILLLRLLIQFFSLQKIKSGATLFSSGKYNVYHVSKPILPFSFGKNIYLNIELYTDAERQKIIQHERVHVQQRHSLDMLVAELVCIVNWYNPFAWMMKNSIRQNLEFIADEAVVNQGFNKINYQYLLLKVSGDLPASFASGLKCSTVKNRIVMMNQARTAPLQLLTFLLMVPVITLLLLAFRDGKDSGRAAFVAGNPLAEGFTLSSLTYSIADGGAKAVVMHEQAHSLLKPGQQFNLASIQDEKERLKDLLQRNGYRHLKTNAIRFMIDTATVKNSFSVEVNIDVAPATVSYRKQHPLNDSNALTAAYAPYFDHSPGRAKAAVGDTRKREVARGLVVHDHLT